MTEINEEPKIDEPENDETLAGGTDASPVEIPEGEE